MGESISIEEAAVRLETSPAFVHRMVDKGRLSPDGKNRLDAAEVEEFGALLKRLRAGGIATVVGAIGEELGSER